MNLNPKTTALLFPGQGSQAVGMARELAGQYPAAAAVLDRADALLGMDLSKIMRDGPDAELNDTVNTQPALFAHSMAAYAVLREHTPEFGAALLAGHSLGELSALAAGGALTLESAIHLVRRRGELMKRAGELNPGGMAAILNLDVETLERVCREASTPDEIVQVANDNSPGQVVISGAQAAVQRAMEMAKQAGARRAIPLAVSIAAHSALMQSIQGEWDAAVESAGVTDSEPALIGNVDAAVIYRAAELRLDIKRQMQNRVRWTESITLAVSQGIDTFVEVGSGSVLIGLVRRIAPQARGIPFGTPEDVVNLLG